MADTAAPEGETPNQRTARLRREKMQKKMAEQGEERLARIKALNGGVAPPAEVLGGPAAPTQPQPGVRANQASVDDPDEVDIDSIQRPPRTSSLDNPLMAAMMSGQGQGGQRQQAGGGGGGAEEEDPMMKMMQSLAGLMGGNPNDPNAPPPDVPPALKALLGAGAAQKDAQKSPETSSAYVWRITHAIFALILAMYVTTTSTFTGSQLARTQSKFMATESSSVLGPRLFILFTSAELVLQSTRFFLERGQLSGSGWLATIANSGMVPEPYAQWVRTAGRYIAIAQTIFADAMVIIFVLGVMAWWNGSGAVAW
ncbi:hypothetical protein BAUCODRAFT_123531 [Baudoinia panamericana UAMH 10762]|uniref:GET complex, subunit GET2 n=1 Tax=Baudoinia panamericana (strain UAMH 10762) TaxID=717646 RepID=M2MU25_BAUPA|nr:uncharacterized protein BAUCODRAFT_123531 [Baudoinia panamericana UAMH 10762]EMC95048.1 hypothetical protein BAUCODRAFT_123531 [Baudoinia panamericana UAMH 10762]